MNRVERMCIFVAKESWEVDQEVYRAPELSYCRCPKSRGTVGGLNQML